MSLLDILGIDLPDLDGGLCAETDPALFFPEKGEGNKSRAAARICARCPIREQCLDEALSRHERYGIWGGVSERDRRKMIRAREGRAA